MKAQVLEPQPDFAEKQKKERSFWSRLMFHHATPQKRAGLRHRPYTKTPFLGESKKRRNMAARSRRINRRY